MHEAIVAGVVGGTVGGVIGSIIRTALDQWFRRRAKRNG